MGHSARSKFEREIRQQRLNSLSRADKEISRMIAIQGALEKAATAKTITEIGPRARIPPMNNSEKEIDCQTDKGTFTDIVRSEKSIEAAAGWRSAPPLSASEKLDNFSRKLDSKRSCKTLGTMSKAAAVLESNSKKLKTSKKRLKNMQSIMR